MPRTVQAIYPRDAYPAPSYCKYFYLCAQVSGDVENKIAGAASAVKNTGLTDGELWANPGYATLGGAAGNYATVAAATHDLTLNGFTLVVCARVKKSAAALPASEQYFIASYDPGVNTGGIIMSCRADGAARLYCNSVGGTTVNVTTAASVITDGATANERTLTFIFPRETGQSAWAGVDGLEKTSAPASAIAGQSLAGGRSMRLGEPLAGGTIAAYQVGSFHAYMVPRDMSAMNRTAIHNWAWRNPHLPIPDWVFGL